MITGLKVERSMYCYQSYALTWDIKIVNHMCFSDFTADFMWTMKNDESHEKNSMTFTY